MELPNLYGSPFKNEAATAQELVDNFEPNKNLYLESLFENTLQSGAGVAQDTINSFRFERTGKKISPQEANELYGLDGALVFDKDIDEGEAIARQRVKLTEVENNWIINKYREQRDFSLTDNVVTDFGFGMAVSMLDPVNVASSFIPVGGFLNNIKGFGTLSATKQAIITGATEGFIGNALAEPLTFTANKDLQLEYGWMDSAMNLGAGIFIGGGIPAVSSLLIGRKSLRTGTGITPETNRMAHETAISQLVQDKPVNVTPILELEQLKAKGLDKVEQRRARRAQRQFESQMALVETADNPKEQLKRAYTEDLSNPSSELSQLPIRDGLERLGFEIKTSKKGKTFGRLGNVTVSLDGINAKSLGGFLDSNTKLKERIINQKASLDAQSRIETLEFTRDSDGRLIDTADRLDIDNTFVRQIDEQSAAFDEMLAKGERAIADIENAGRREDASRIYDDILEEIGDFADPSFVERLNRTFEEADVRLQNLEEIENISKLDISPEEKVNQLRERLDLESLDEDLLTGVFRGDTDAIEEAFEISEFVKAAKSQKQLEKEFLQHAQNANRKMDDGYLIDTTRIDEAIARSNGDTANEYLNDFSLEERQLNEILERNPEFQEEIKTILSQADDEIRIVKAKQKIIEEAKLCISNGGMKS